MAHRENASLVDSGKVPALTSGGGLRRGGFNRYSFRFHLLGTILLAHQFALASAEDMCTTLNSFKLGWDMVGLITALGTSAAMKSLTFSALNNSSSAYVTGHVGPGSLAMAAAVLYSTGYSLARLMAAEGMPDMSRLFQLDKPTGLRYIGLKSNTECPVGNAVGARVVREHTDLWKDEIKGHSTRNSSSRVDPQRPELGRQVGRDAKRNVEIIILELQDRRSESTSWANTGSTPVSTNSPSPSLEMTRMSSQSEGTPESSQSALSSVEKRPVPFPSLQNAANRSVSSQGDETAVPSQPSPPSVGQPSPFKADRRPVSLTAARKDAFLLGWLPFLLTIAVVVSCYRCRQAVIASAILLGTFGMTVAVGVLRLCPFTFDKAKVAVGAPTGDCLVVDEVQSNTFHIIHGHEEDIQVLLQRPINEDLEGERFGRMALVLSGTMLYVYAIMSVLTISSGSTSGLLHYVAANFIGLVADVFKGSRNGALGLAKNARKQFRIRLKDYVVFGNRTAAVACLSKHASDPTMLKSKKLLPCDGPVWTIWWDKLPEFACTGEISDEYIKNVDSGIEAADQQLLRQLLYDMRDGLSERLRD